MKQLNRSVFPFIELTQTQTFEYNEPGVQTSFTHTQYEYDETPFYGNQTRNHPICISGDDDINDQFCTEKPQIIPMSISPIMLGKLDSQKQSIMNIDVMNLVPVT